MSTNHVLLRTAYLCTLCRVTGAKYLDLPACYSPTALDERRVYFHVQSDSVSYIADALCNVRGETQSTIVASYENGDCKIVSVTLAPATVSGPVAWSSIEHMFDDVATTAFAATEYDKVSSVCTLPGVYAGHAMPASEPYVEIFYKSEHTHIDKRPCKILAYAAHGFGEDDGVHTLIFPATRSKERTVESMLFRKAMHIYHSGLYREFLNYTKHWVDLAELYGHYQYPNSEDARVLCITPPKLEDDTLDSQFHSMGCYSVLDVTYHGHTALYTLKNDADAVVQRRSNFFTQVAA